MIQDIKDRVPVNVLSNNAIRYGIYDEQGNFLRYEYIKREDEPIEIGTPVNRALFSNMQGDLYTADRYNIPKVKKESLGTKEIVKTDNLFYQNWEHVSNYTEYEANNGMKLYATSTNSEQDTPDLAFDTVRNTYWHIDYNGSSTQELKVTFPNPVKILKMRLTANTDASTPRITSIKIFGEKQDSETVELFDVYSAFGAEPNNSVITLNNQDNYISYTLQLKGTPSYGMDVAEWSVLEYSSYEEVIEYINTLSLPLTSYETGKVLNLECASNYYGEKEVTKSGNIFPTEWTANETYDIFTADGYTLFASSHVSGQYPYYVSDNNSNTYWRPLEGITHYIEMVCPKPTKISKMRINPGVSVTWCKSLKILGKKEGDEWVLLGNGGFTSDQEVTLTNLDYYIRYRVVYTMNSESDNISFYRWETTEYIEVEENPELTKLENPYININNLGAKQINGTIVAGEKYNLIYNGESWDFTKPYRIIRGTYSGKNDPDTGSIIDLGGKPKAVLVYSNERKFGMWAFDDGTSYGTNNVDYSSSTDEKWEQSYTVSRGNITITDTGFIGTGSDYNINAHGFDNESITYNYIAIF